MNETPRTDRGLANIHIPQLARPVPKSAGMEMIGGVADGLGRLMNGLGGLVRLRAQDDNEEAEVMLARFKNHIRDKWNGCASVNENGEEIRIAGAKEKTWKDYAKDKNALEDYTAITNEFYESENYKEMRPAVRKIFDRKAEPVRQGFLTAVTEKVYKDGLAMRKDRRAEIVQSLARGVEDRFGMAADDFMYEGARENACLEEAIITMGDDIENPDEARESEDGAAAVRFRNDPQGAKRQYFDELVSAKRKAYDLHYIDSLNNAAAMGAPLGELAGEKLVERSKSVLEGMKKRGEGGDKSGLDEAEYAKVKATVDEAERRFKKRKAYALAETTREIADSLDADSFEIGKLLYAPNVDAGEVEGRCKKLSSDIEKAVASGMMDARTGERYRSHFRTMQRVAERLQAEKAAQESGDFTGIIGNGEGWTATEDTPEAMPNYDEAPPEEEEDADGSAPSMRSRHGRMTSAGARAALNELLYMETDIERCELEGTAEARSRAARLRSQVWIAMNELYDRRGMTSQQYRSFLSRWENRLSRDELVAMQIFDNAFGLDFDLGAGGKVSATERKAFLDEGGDVFDPRDERKSIPREDVWQYRERFRRRLKALGPDVNRREVVEEEVRALRAERDVEKWQEMIMKDADLSLRFGNYQIAARMNREEGTGKREERRGNREEGTGKREEGMLPMPIRLVFNTEAQRNRDSQREGREEGRGKKTEERKTK